MIVRGNHQSMMQSGGGFHAAQRRNLLLTILLPALFLVHNAGAQYTGKISGVVKDQESGETLAGVNVTIPGTMLGAATDIEGTFFILNVPPGKYSIQASMMGYRKMIQQNVIVNGGKTTVVNFTLRSEALSGKDVIVEAVRPDVEPEKTSTSAIIRTDDVQQLAGMRDVGNIIGLAADVTDGHFRGGRAGEEYYTLQGMGIVNPLDNGSAFMPIMSAVEEVEVITSGFGAQYGNAQSGIVNISMKEGKSDRWRTTAEIRSRMPGRKHFGPSVYDPEANGYLKFLLNPQSWLRSDATNQTFFQSFGLNNILRNDTLTQLAAAMVLWRYQTKRDMYRSYGNQLDYSGEAATGGPISDGVRMFLALRSNVNWPAFPTEQPDVERQVMGNLVTDVGRNMALRLSGGYSIDQRTVFPSWDGLGYQEWLWDRILSVDYQTKENVQAGLRFTQTLDQSTFLEVKLNTLWTDLHLGASPSPTTLVDSIANRVTWSTILVNYSTSPDYFTYLQGDDNYRHDQTRTISVEASLTSQVTKSHLLNAGVQFNSYRISADDAYNTTKGKNIILQKYTHTPYEGALYVQDKMEFQGMIANIGLRLDLWNANTSFAGDAVNRVIQKADSTGTTTFIFNPEKISKVPILGRLQPRVGISFPVSTTTVFHVNYGSFMQRPSFQYLLAARSELYQSMPVFIGNPRLLPQTTNSYDVGVMQGLGEGFTLDISGYYKDVKDLIEQANFFDQALNLTYSSYFNRDNADIRGFRVSLGKRKGWLSGSVNYHYSVATGKAASVGYAPVTFTIDQGGVSTNSAKVASRDVLLTFDRTHNLIINLVAMSDEEFGPQVFQAYPLANMAVSFSSTMMSGRPYTSPSDPLVYNGARTPAEYRTNLKISKRVDGFFGTRATFYVEVFNVFNDKILNYDYIFAMPDAKSTSKRAEAYEKYPVDDPVHGVLFWNDENSPDNVNTPFPVNQSFLVYGNQPRSVTIGVAVDF